MEKADINMAMIDGYMELLSTLNPNEKLELISKLTNSIKVDLQTSESSFKNSFGALDTTKTAEEVIDEIRDSRVSTRKTESF